MGGPLADVRIIDISAILMGPLATQVVADLGAEVIKFEALGDDDARHVGDAPSPGIGPGFIHISRWKKSLSVDLKSIADDPHLKDVSFSQTIDHLLAGRMRTMPQPGSWSETPIDPAGPAPALGQHTRAILAGAGCALDEVQRLIGDGVVAATD